MNHKYLPLVAFAASFFALSTPPVSAVSSINLTTFGSAVQPGGGWSYNPSTSTISGNDTEGALLFPSTFSPVDLTTLANYGGSPSNFRLNLTGFVTTFPGGAFTISLEDATGNISATAFLWDSFTTLSSTVVSPVNTSTASPNFQWNNIAGWTLDAGGTGNAVNATFTSLSVTAVPEPSTYALLAMGGLALGGYMLRRRRRA